MRLVSDETKKGAVVVRRETLNLRDIGTRIESRSFFSDTMSLPNRNTHTPLAHTLP